MLAYLMVMGFLNYGGGSTGMLKGLAGGALLLGTLMALMPVGIFVFAGPKAGKSKSKDDQEDVETSRSDDEVDAVEEDAGDDGEDASGGMDSMAETGAWTAGDASDEDDLELASSAEMDTAEEATDDSDFEVAVADDADEDTAQEPDGADDELPSAGDMDFEFDDEEEDEPPAKGKKK